MSFTAQITANIKDFEKSLDKAAGEMSKFEKDIEKRVNQVADGFLNLGKKMSVFSMAVGAAVAGAVAFVKSAGDMANDMMSVAVAVDASTDTLQEFAHVAVMAGTDAKTFENATEMLVKRLKDIEGEGKGAPEMIRNLGVAMVDAEGNMRRVGDISQDLITRLAEIENVSQRNVIASQLFGRQWAQVAPILDLGAEGIAQFREEAHKLGLVLSEDSLQGANNFAVAMNSLGQQLQAVKNQLGADLAPLLMESFIPFIENNVMPAIRGFAEKIAELVKWFNNLSPTVKGIIATLLGVTAAIGPVLLGLGGLLKMLPLLKVAFAALTSPVSLVVMAVVGAATLIIANWDKIKEYFTSGPGAAVFESVKNLAVSLYNVLKATFEMIKDAILAIWEKFGGTLTSIWRGAFLQVRNILDVFLKVMSGVANTLTRLIKGDWGGALRELYNLFAGIFQSINNLVFGAVATISSVLAGMFKAIKLDNLSDKLQGFADRLNDKIASTLPAMKQQEAAVKAVEEATEESTKAVKENTIAIQGNVGAMIARVAAMEEIARNPITMRVGVELDSGSLEVDKMGELIEQNLEKLKGKAQEFTLDVGGMISDSVTGLMEGIGSAIGEGTNVIDAIGVALIGTIAGLAVTIGKQMIAFGVAGEALQKLLLSPVTAIVAGAALVALGSAAKAAVGGSMSSAGVRGGGGYSGGASGTYGDRQSVGASSLRGAYKDDFKVEFKIGNDALVGTLDTAQQKKNRTIG